MRDVQIQVSLEGKGEITIVQKVDVTGKELKKLTAHCIELLKETRSTQRIGFSAGGGFHDEVDVDD